MPRIALVALLLLLPKPAAAQDAAAVLEVAEEALAEGDAGRALELARMARVLAPQRSEDALMLMAEALTRLDRPAAAQRLYRRAVAQRGPRRNEALAGIVQVNQRLATLRVMVHPAHAQVTVDGEPAEWERGGRILLVPVGTHHIVARAPGHEAREVNRHFGAEGLHEVRLLLPEGEESRSEYVSGPRNRRDLSHWISGNLLQTGLGVVGVGLAGAWIGTLHGQQGPGVELEMRFAQFELGASLGLALAAQGQLAIYDATEGEGTGMVGLSAGVLMVAASLVTSIIGSSYESGSQELMLVSGLLAGGGASAVGNSMLDRRYGDVGLSLVLTSFTLGFSQLALAMAAGGAPGALPGHEAFVDYSASLPADTDACAQVASGDTLGGQFADQMGTLEGTCAQRAALDRARDVALGTAISTALLSLGTGLLTVAVGDELDFAIAAGPTSIQLSGGF